MKIFYYTATGNSLYVAKRLGGELFSVPQEINKNIACYEDDVIGIVFPTYCFMPPKMLRKFLEQTAFKAEYLFAVAVYGNKCAKVSESVQKFAKKSDFRFDYVDKILMVDNYLPFFDINEQIEKIPTKNTEEKLSEIKNNIENRVIQKKLKYNLGEHFLQIVGESVNHFALDKNFSKKYIINDSCVNCGICTKVCPTKNISIKDKPVFADNCESCLACIHACPKNAIHLKSEKSNKRWINPNITLQEIIDSNNCK